MEHHNPQGRLGSPGYYVRILFTKLKHITNDQQTSEGDQYHEREKSKKKNQMHNNFQRDKINFSIQTLNLSNTK